jgi:hypothetical protein
MKCIKTTVSATFIPFSGGAKSKAGANAATITSSLPNHKFYGPTSRGVFISGPSATSLLKGGAANSGVFVAKMFRDYCFDL